MSDQVEPTERDADTTFEGWAELGWEERRARRVQRWTNPAGVTFVDDVARRGYEERVQLMVDALALRTPARVPISPMAGFFIPRYAGLTVKEAMYEYDKLRRAWIGYHDDFLPDFQASPTLPGLVYDLLGVRYMNWPGHGVDDDTPWQYVEAEYMRADEYDALIADPSAYFRRTLLPRIASGFEPLAVLDPFSDFVEGAALPFGLLPFADPAVLEGLRKLAAAGEATLEYLEVVAGARREVAGRLGLPVLASGAVKAPYDTLADTLRGTNGIIMDRFRQPAKILEAAERLVPLQIDLGLRQKASAESPLIWINLHKGAEGFMSDADFRQFYWPTLKAVVKGLVDEGVVPVLFAEGGYTKRLPVIVDDDLPAGSVIWWFDQTDMVAAKEAMRGYACIAGNVPSAMLAVGTATQVEDYVTKLLCDVAADGGFILGSGAVIDDAKPETVRAMISSGRAWSCR
jgi:uroporphyrinogen-III decarboxylase